MRKEITWPNYKKTYREEDDYLLALDQIMGQIGRKLKLNTKETILEVLVHLNSSCDIHGYDFKSLAKEAKKQLKSRKKNNENYGSW